MHRAIASRFLRVALSTVLPLTLLAASTGLCLAMGAAGVGKNAANVRSPSPRGQDSGIRGQVLIGPSKPSTRIGEPSHDQPFQATLDIVKAEDESLVTQIRTGRNGTFVVGLAPGDYIVRSASTEEIPRPAIEAVEVTVPAHAYVDVTINADNGMR